MMEFWSENQGQSQVYSRFGTVPGRNCAHSYQDRHQAAHCALRLGEQQAHGESRDWTLPASRTALHQYTNWTDPSSSSSHFPVILDTQHHHDQGEYQQHEASDREWTSHRAVRDYERGFLREGWQRRWEPSNPLCYSREDSAKRNDSNYRELEAWAARYSHSLPRRRRLEAELRGSSKGLVERDCRYGTDPQIHLQHVQLDPNSRMSEFWERGCRTQAPPYYPPQAPATDRNYMKENISSQRRIFSQPPGYVAPPPYKNPPKSSPLQHYCDTSLEQLGRTQAHRSQLAPRKQNLSKDLEQEEFRKSHESKTCPELEGLKHKNQEEDALQDATLMKTQKSQIQSESIMALEDPKIKQETISKVIEGRKFRLNKKTGGMTIFCLVSRIANGSETLSLPVSTSQTIQSPERGEVSNDVKDEINQLADEVDFKAPTCTGKEVLEDDLQNKVEGDMVSLENLTANSVRQVGPLVPPVSVKYPLWREPSSMSSAGHLSKHSTDREKMDNEDRKGLLVIDTSCVVVKVELIPSPKKEHVHYSDSSMNKDQTLVSSELNHQLDQDMPSDQIKGALKTSQGPETDLGLALLEKENKRESEDSFSSMQPSPLPETETLEERAERILGIHLPDGVIEQQPEDEESFSESPDEEVVLCLSEQTPDDAAEQEESQNHQEVVQTDEAESFKDSEDFRSQVTDEYADLSKDDTDLHFQTVTKTSTEDPHLESTSKPVDGESAKPSDLSNSSFPSCESSFLLMLSNTEEEFDPKLVTSSNLAPHPDTSPPSLLQLPSPPSESTDSSFNSTSLTDHLPSPPNLEVRLPPVDEASGAEHEDRNDESGVNSESLDSDMKQEVMSQQQDEFHQSDAAANEPEKHLGVNTLPQQLGCVQTEGGGEKSPQGNDEDHTDDKIQIPELDEEREDNTSEGPKDGNLLKDEDALCIKESVVIPEESQTSPGLIAGSSQVTDTQIQIKTEILSVQAQASDSECEESLLDEIPLSDFPSPPQAPPESENDFNPLLEIEPVSPSPLSFDIPITDTVGTSSFYLDSESSQFSCSLSSSPPTFTPHADSPHASPPAAHKEKTQYPKTLRDVVTRIRKHTAPDSETEEEEVGELWDPEIVYENLVVDVRPEINLDEAEEQEVLKESAEIGYLEQDDKELHADEDTLSCSSTSSHVSEDTIIIAEEKRRLYVELEEKNEEFDSAVGETCCSSEVQEETSSRESEEEANKSGESEEHLEEVEN